MYADRFLGFAWLAVSYFDPPMRPFDLQGFVKIMRSTYGRDMYGYWELLTQEDAHKICEKNVSESTIIHVPSQWLMQRTPSWRVSIRLRTPRRLNSATSGSHRGAR